MVYTLLVRSDEECSSSFCVTAVDTPEGTIYYTYDPITGRKTNTSTASGNTNTNYYYDELGRLAGTGTTSENTYYHYDEVGNRKWLCIDKNGDFDYSDPTAPTNYEIKTDYTYDPLNRLTDLLQQKTNGGSLSSYNYTLKANGHRHSLNESLTLNETRNITYGYDDLNRLTSETADLSGDGYDVDYTYDLVGNRMSRVVKIYKQNNPDPAQTLTTTYDNLGTDKLYTETHNGPVYAVSLRENDIYYAYAAPNGGYFYRDNQGRKITGLRAFFMGLPSVWSRYMFILAMALVPILLFGPGLLRLTKRYVLRRPIKVRLRVPRKGICLFVAFVMLLGPESFHNLSRADVQYANLSTASWANGDTTITYTYDNNGSVETKTTVTSSVVKEIVTYHYNLAGRLARVWTDTDSSSSTNTVDIVDYKYNDDGIRVEKYSFSVAQDFLDTGAEQFYATDQKTTTYLVDSRNHTGYAQTLEELTFNKANPDLQVDTPDSVRTYVIGDDVIAQTVNGTTQYLLYDGHGSTRQLAEYNTEVTIVDDFTYDGYGVLLQNEGNFIPPNGTQDPGKVAQQATSLLYAGEHFDTDMQNYYLRARWYDSLSGRFNRMDPFPGNNQDPQSLHKYLYVHCNPINGADPTGMMSLSSTIITMGIMSSITSIYNFAVLGYTSYSVGKNGLDLSGIIINLFGGASSHGFGGSVCLSIYYDFGTNRPYLFVSGDVGLIPLSWFKTQRGLDYGFGIGAIFNAENPGDLSDGSSTATWPICMMGWVAPGPLKLSSHWAIMMNLAKAVKNTPRSGQASFQIQKSWSSKAFEASFMVGTYSFAGTASWASEPIDIIEGLNDLSEETRNVVSRIQVAISGIKEDLDKPGLIKQYVDRIQQLIDEI